MKKTVLAVAAALGLWHSAQAEKVSEEVPTHVIEVQASTREERTAVSAMGYALEDIRSDRVYIYGWPRDLERLEKAGFKAQAQPFKESWKRWTTFANGQMDGAHYRSYSEVQSALRKLEATHPAIASLRSLGTSLEGRDMMVLRLSGRSPGQAEQEKLPVVFFEGCHHAREYLSVEVPLQLAEYLVAHYDSDADIKRLIDTREVYIAPIANPDGYVFDYSNGQSGRLWRKNRAQNADGSHGVDLNRNYDYAWDINESGSSSEGSAETFRGASPFSEPETQHIRDFINSQTRLTTMLSYHSFSQLILYPWGFTYDNVGDANVGGKVEDRHIFEKMAGQMAGWNHYTPEKISDLYLVNGSDLDWAYGTRGIFGFTIELTPTMQAVGGNPYEGFYPEPTVIPSAFAANLKPMLYLIEYADNPRRVLSETVPTFLAIKTPARQGLPLASAKDLSF